MICPNEILLQHDSMGKQIKIGHKYSHQLRAKLNQLHFNEIFLKIPKSNQYIFATLKCLLRSHLDFCYYSQVCLFSKLGKKEFFRVSH